MDDEPPGASTPVPPWASRTFVLLFCGLVLTKTSECRTIRIAGAVSTPEEDLAAAEVRLRMFLAQYWGWTDDVRSDTRGHPRLGSATRRFAFTTPHAGTDG
jgi:hypothetical protein